MFPVRQALWRESSRSVCVFCQQVRSKARSPQKAPSTSLKQQEALAAVRHAALRPGKPNKDPGFQMPDVKIFSAAEKAGFIKGPTRSIVVAVHSFKMLGKQLDYRDAHKLCQELQISADDLVPVARILLREAGARDLGKRVLLMASRSGFAGASIHLVRHALKGNDLHEVAGALKHVRRLAADESNLAAMVLDAQIRHNEGNNAAAEALLTKALDRAKSPENMKQYKKSSRDQNPAFDKLDEELGTGGTGTAWALLAKMRIEEGKYELGRQAYEEAALNFGDPEAYDGLRGFESGFTMDWVKYTKMVAAAGDTQAMLDMAHYYQYSDEEIEQYNAAKLAQFASSMTDAQKAKVRQSQAAAQRERAGVAKLPPVPHLGKGRIAFDKEARTLDADFTYVDAQTALVAEWLYVCQWTNRREEAYTELQKLSAEHGVDRVFNHNLVNIVNWKRANRLP